MPNHYRTKSAQFDGPQEKKDNLDIYNLWLIAEIILKEPDWSILVYFSHHILSTFHRAILRHFPQRIVCQLVAFRICTRATFIEVVAFCCTKSQHSQFIQLTKSQDHHLPFVNIPFRNNNKTKQLPATFFLCKQLSCFNGNGSLWNLPQNSKGV